MNNLTRVNSFLNQVSQKPAPNEVILDAPDAVRNILANELVKIQKLDLFTTELLKYLMDPKAIKSLSYSQKQSMLNTISAIQSNSRDFLFKVAEMSSKYEIFRQLIKSNPNSRTERLVTSENGETYTSIVTDEEIKELSEALRDIAEEQTFIDAE